MRNSGRALGAVALTFAGILLQAAPAAANGHQPPVVLRAYGPGGPHHVIKECAALFEEQSGVAVAVIKASPAELAQRVPEDGDLYYAGAEYMLEEFANENPGVLDMCSAQNLHPRRIGLVVRKGNPRAIKGVECLEREGIDLLTVHLENMEEVLPADGEWANSVRRRVSTGQEGVNAWLSTPELDAWVTYESWHVWLENDSEFIGIPGDHARRYTPVALTRHTPHRAAAERFIAFLKSPAARQVFVEHGWE